MRKLVIYTLVMMTISMFLSMMTVVMSWMEDDRAKCEDRHWWLTAQLCWGPKFLPLMRTLVMVAWRIWIISIAIVKMMIPSQMMVSGPRHSCGFMPLSQFRHNRRPSIASHFTSAVTSECQRYQQGINPNPDVRVVQGRASCEIKSILNYSLTSD